MAQERRSSETRFAETRFAELLSEVASEITRRQSSEVCCGDLTWEQFHTLRTVSASAEPSIGLLSAQLRVDLSTMSRNATVLERNGYLVRGRDAADARVVRVKLTTKGKRALETLNCGERDVLQDVYQRLPSAERPKVVSALAALSECLKSVGDEKAACCAR